MRVAVYDTYVTKKDGGVMHFDILVPESNKSLQQIYAYGKEYLQAKGQGSQLLNAKECTFCHIEQATEPMLESIAEKGYYIIEMEGCSG